MSLTQVRKLRSGRTVWALHPIRAIRGTRLRRSTNAEVVIVGAGISGAIMAQSLAEAGLRPLIVDRRNGALQGSTAASTALLQFELDTPLLHLGKAIGRRNAARAWLASRDAVNDLRSRTRELGIRADLRTRPSLYLAGNLLDARGLQREVALRQRLGLPSEFLDRRNLQRHFGIRSSGAILSHGNAEANPVAMAAGYLRQALRHGARLHAPHDIVDIECGRNATTLLTGDGLELRARHVVLCTGYELAKIVPPNGSSIHSTWVIATRPQRRAQWPEKALIWEASDPYLYLRTTPDGRIICGGEDEEFASAARRDELTASKSQRLQQRLHAILPAADCQAQLAWSGSFGGSRHGIPTIGAIPGFRRCYAVMGYGGNGITFSMLAAGIITSAITGRKSDCAPLFRFRSIGGHCLHTSPVSSRYKGRCQGPGSRLTPFTGSDLQHNDHTRRPLAFPDRRSPPGPARGHRGGFGRRGHQQDPG